MEKITCIFAKPPMICSFLQPNSRYMNATWLHVCPNILSSGRCLYQTAKCENTFSCIYSVEEPVYWIERRRWVWLQVAINITLCVTLAYAAIGWEIMSLLQNQCVICLGILGYWCNMADSVETHMLTLKKKNRLGSEKFKSRSYRNRWGQGKRKNFKFSSHAETQAKYRMCVVCVCVLHCAVWQMLSHK